MPKGRTIRKLIGGRDGRSTKKIFAQGKIKWKKKIHARQLILKNFMLWPKKIHSRTLITKKYSCGSKIPLPHNFSNGPSLISGRGDLQEGLNGVVAFTVIG